MIEKNKLTDPTYFQKRLKLMLNHNADMLESQFEATKHDESPALSEHLSCIRFKFNTSSPTQSMMQLSFAIDALADSFAHLLAENNASLLELM